MDKRVKFGFEIFSTNGGSIKGEDFRLDIFGENRVGIDSHNIANTAGKLRPVHTILLGAEILIVEHLCNLYLLPKDGFTFSAVPPKFKGVGTFPVRAMAKLKKTN